MDREKETIILEQLSQNKDPIKQRELAEIAGLSLGMTNGLLKRMADKGFLMMEKVNSRNIKYILTPQGHRELNRRIKNYMKGHHKERGLLPPSRGRFGEEDGRYRIPGNHPCGPERS